MMKIKLTFGFGAILFLGSFFPAHAASLYLSPSQTSLTTGQTVVVTVFASSVSQALNAVSGDISFPTDKFRVLSTSEANSIINFWVQNPSFSNSAGNGDISFQGIVLSPGFTGQGGAVLKITLQAVGSGSASLSFSTGSILANDGNGTDILSSLQGANFTIVAASSLPAAVNPNLPPAPTISSVTHPDEDQWYNQKSLQLSWPLPDGVDGVSYVLYAKPDLILPSLNKGVLSSVSFDLTTYSEGTWYAYVKFHNAAGWGPTSVRRVNIDFSPPAPFVLTNLSAANDDLTDPQPMFAWSTTDSVSGVAKYMVKIGSGDWFDAATIAASTTSGQYRLPLQVPEQNALVTVDAYDHAGNIAEATATFSVAPLPMPTILSYSNSISSARPVLTVSGSVPEEAGVPVTSVRLIMQKAADVVTYLVSVDQHGRWSLDQIVSLPAGTWTLAAQSTDARGALSLMTPSVSVAVGGWFSDALKFIFSWSALIAVGIVLVAVIVAIVYLFIYRMRQWRLVLSRELLAERKELRDDLTRIEKELKDDPAKQEIVRKEVEHLEIDLRKDAEKVKEREN